MKSKVLSLITLLTIFSPSAFAFLTPQEESAFVTALNKLSADDGVTFTGVHCSGRSRLCIVKLTMDSNSNACVVERVMDSSDLITTSADKTVHVAPYAQSAIASCIQKFQ